MASLELKNLSISYNKTKGNIINNLNLKVDPGQILIVTGRSGSGKSTLIHAINGIIPHYIKADLSGQINIDDKNIIDLDIGQRSKYIGSVLQNPDSQIIFDDIKDELSFPMENMGMDHQTISQRLDEVLGLIDLDQTTSTHKLSGGEKQKLITGSTLVMGQKILLLDEPLANLDIDSTLNLMELLKSLKGQGYLVIVVEHRLDICLDYGDVFLWLDEDYRVFRDKEDFKEFYQSKRPSYKIKSRSTKDKEKLIELKDISWVKEDKEILKDINFCLHKGEKWNILGDNGAGKSSLLNIIAGLEDSSSGSIKYHFDKSKLYEKLGYIFQNPDYQLFMATVEEEIQYKQAYEELGEFVIRSLDLEPYRKAHPQSLSQGQKRRLAVGAILASKPEILIFDEPTVGQDSRSLGLILETIDQIYEKEELTMITVSHEKDLWENFGDKYFYIEDGQGREIKTLRRIYLLRADIN